MTERLAQLMHAEADHLHIPPPDPSITLARGRALRRRRRLAAGVTALAVVAVIGGGALGVKAVVGDESKRTEPAAPFDSGAVFAIGATVYLDNAEVQAAIDDKAIKSLHYTSVGVLVRHGNNAYSDGGGPQRFSMVRPDGTVDRLDVTLEETVHSTDPTQPYMAYALKTDTGYDVVVRDLRDDTEAARIAIPGGGTGGGWPAPPVSLAGETVYVGTDPTPYAVDWHTGEVTETDAIEPGLPSVQGGREAQTGDGHASVVDVATGQVLLDARVPGGEDGYGYFDLSPDGRYAVLRIEQWGPDAQRRPGVEVYTVDTGDRVTLDGPSDRFGWTGMGDLFRVGGRELTTCDATTGKCTTEPHGIEMPPPTPKKEVCRDLKGGNSYCEVTGGETWESQLKLGGQMYES